MRPLSSDLREFIHLLNTKSVKYVIVGARSTAEHVERTTLLTIIQYQILG
jgi:hypothetical protein